MELKLLPLMGHWLMLLVYCWCPKIEESRAATCLSMKSNHRSVDCSSRKLQEFPDTLSNDTTVINLRNNTISKVDYDNIKYLINLEYLDLSYNRICTLKPGAFRTLSRLRYLDLSSNCLCLSYHCFPIGSFNGLVSMTKLKLARNMYYDPLNSREYPMKSFAEMPQLEELTISPVHDVIIRKDVRSLERLKLIDFFRGDIVNMSVRAFHAIQYTKVSTISFRANDDLEFIETGIFSNFTHLKRLVLICNSNVGFHSTMRALGSITNSGIETLVLDHANDGKAIGLKRTDFCNPFTKQLKHLSIQANGILASEDTIGECWSSLETLRAGYNTPLFGFTKYHKPHTRDMSLFWPPKLVVLDMSFLFGDWHWYKSKYCRNENIRFDELFRHPPDLSDIIINDDLIQNTSAFLPKDEELVTLSPPTVRYVYLDNAFIATHFETTSLYLTDNDMLYFNGSHNNCLRQLKDPMVGFWKLLVVDLSHGILQYISPEAFKHMPNLRYLNLSNNELGVHGFNYKNVFTNLYSLVELDLSASKLSTLDKNAFANLKALKILNLSYNRIQNISLILKDLVSLQKLDLTKNNIQHLKKEFIQEIVDLSQITNVTVDLNENPLKCDCEAIFFIRWVQNAHSILRSGHKLTCKLNDIETPVSDISLASLERECQAMTMIIAVTIATCLVVAIISSLAMFKYQWHIRWYYYITKRHFRRRRRLRSTEIDMEILEFSRDLNVIYANANYSYACGDLRRMLEDDWGVELYLFDRDSEPGLAVAENIVDGLKRCRKVLILLTSQFVEDQWCDFALNMALTKNRENLCFLYMEDLRVENMSKILLQILSPNSGYRVLEWKHDEYAQLLFRQQLADFLGIDLQQ